jgi:hypothetical protein
MRATRSDLGTRLYRAKFLIRHDHDTLDDEVPLPPCLLPMVQLSPFLLDPRDRDAVILPSCFRVSSTYL